MWVCLKMGYPQTQWFLNVSHNVCFQLDYHIFAGVTLFQSHPNIKVVLVSVYPLKPNYDTSHPHY